MSRFLGTCVENPFEDVNVLSNLIDEAKEIGRTRFLNRVEVDPENRHMMFKFPHDYSYFVNGSIYFFTWSMIEHFFEVGG